MSTDGLEPLLEPVRLGPVRAKNRVFVAPHTTNFSLEGEHLITERHLAYHGARAQGGAGLVITEGLRVHPTSLRRLGLQIYSDEAVPGLGRLADVVHAHGALLFGQLLHTGRHTGDDRWGAWAPSPLPWALGAAVPHAMNRRDIETVVACFASAARRLVAAGFDGMEVHLGHGHLLQQFLSPATNERVDDYGGTAENRLRLAAEVLAAVTEAVEGRAAVGVRLSADEFLPNGLDLDAMVGVIARLRQDAALDFLHVSHSAYIGTPSLDTQMADMTYPTAAFRHLPARFKREFPGVPVLAICRIDDLETGAELVRGGEADLVGFARAHIAEPALLRGTLDGTAVRSCIACNQGCNGNLEQSLPITCTVNPAVGLESEWTRALALAPSAQRVLVVGGGPAGLEAAATAARRGHEVSLWEAGAELGGRIRDAARLVGRRRMAMLADELTAEVLAAGIELETGRRAEASAIAAEGFDAVVVATGALEEPAPGTYGVVAALDLDVGPSDRVVVVDELGLWQGAGLAEHLAAAGAAVDLVSATGGFAWNVTVYSRLALGERLGKLGVRVRPLRAVRRIEPDGTVVLADVLTGEEESLAGVTAVVRAAPPRSSDGLLDELLACGYGGEVHLVGDAYAPRTCREAVFEGRGAGVAIGTAGIGSSGLPLRPPYLLEAVA